VQPPRRYFLVRIEQIFRSGTATVSEPPLGASKPYECFMGGGQILFCNGGSSLPVDYLTLLPN
jgi:hypothetical protein